METKKFYPSAEELTKITNLVYCPEKGCVSIFKSESNLVLHLAKTHKKEQFANCLTKQENLIREYYCPNDSCVYNKSKCFKSIKLLKQHYLKVHSEKDFLCDKCEKGFPTETAKNNHQEYCGINFKCSECAATYTCYDTLTTHGRRKKHKIMPKMSYKDMMYVIKPSTSLTSTREKLILPKPIMSDMGINLNDKGSQTDIHDGQPQCKARRTKKSIYSIHTQTLRNIYPQSSAETQTIGDYFSTKAINVIKSPSTDSLNRKHINTQTADIISTTKSSNTTLNVNDLNLIEKSTLGTQTLEILNDLLENSAEPGDNINEYINSSCQTNFNENLDDFDTNTFFNCNTQTQTDFILNNDFDLLTSDYYASNYTQTCDDIFDIDLVFNDIETQTVTNDILRSVGSQTTMSLNIGANGGCRDMTHIETQTDIAFKQLLEEINA